MEHYGKPADLAHLMQQWNKDILHAGKFLQQMDPVDGTFTNDTGDYSPAALVFIDFTWRLAGVRQAGDSLEWNIRPQKTEIRSAFRLQVSPTRIAEIKYASGHAELFLNGKLWYRTASVVRLVTGLYGQLQSAVGISTETTNVIIRPASDQEEEKFSLKPNSYLIFDD